MADFLATCPTQLNKLKPFFARAREFEQRNPLVAYLCRQYAAQLGLEALQGCDPETKGALSKFLMGLMDHLEAEKADPAKCVPNGKVVLLENAYLIFKRADDRERAGNGDKACIAMFTTASHLMEASKQFGEWDPDVAQKYKYARYTASQINKAITSGMPYVSPNVPVADDDGDVLMEDESPAPSPIHQDPVAPAAPTPPPPPPNALASMDVDDLLKQLSADPPVQPAPEAPAVDDLEALLASSLAGTQPAAVPTAQPAAVDSMVQRELEKLELENLRLKAELDTRARDVETARAEAEKYKQLAEQVLQQARAGGGAASASVLQAAPGYNPGLKEVMDAQKCAKFVVSALQFNDLHSARENLQKCAKKLNGA
eukprot:TRINITY_DN27277_c0_g1_i1.p1 TRINITY_DN27277_c0_g1~~TRINITY_DN27277_c0_g1_i1.p1  ORF type:complete len:390 (+),score=137.80 TRINITY_DN27277_c0_g1_i1:56-1171(+)